MDVEISRIIRSGWRIFITIKERVQSKTRRINLFNSTVLPAMLYESTTWANTKKEEQSLITTKWAMERSRMLLPDDI